MTRDTRRSGFRLVLIGFVGAVFFWVTDPKFGLFEQSGTNAIDAGIQAWPGTYVGVAGSVLVLLLGVWLMTRRTA